MEAMTQRVCDQVMLFATDPAQVMAWLSTLGCVVTPQEGGQTWQIHGIAGGNTACGRGDDPITVASSLAFALAGQWWPDAFPGLMDEVSKAWAARRKATPPPVAQVIPPPVPPAPVHQLPLLAEDARQLILF